MGNEVQFVERADGSVLLNARNAKGSQRRKSAISGDGGKTWSALKDEPELIEPQCCGSICRMKTGDASFLVYSGPDSEKQRVSGTLWISRNDGATWPVKKKLVEGPFAYSCLTQTADGKAGIIYEGGTKGPYEKIIFARFPVAWLTSP